LHYQNDNKVYSIHMYKVRTFVSQFKVLKQTWK